MPVPPPIPAASGIYPGAVSAAHPGPKKETARINLMPEPAAISLPRVNMKKTQPLRTGPVPTAAIAPMPLMVAPARARGGLDSIPQSFCWGLLAISAVTFLIQIWNYFVA